MVSERKDIFTKSAAEIADGLVDHHLLNEKVLPHDEVGHRRLRKIADQQAQGLWDMLHLPAEPG